MAHAENEITIRRPAAEVFSFLADGLNNTRWRPGVRSIALASGVAGTEGAVYSQTLAGPGPYTVFVPDDAAFNSTPAGTFDANPKNRAQITGVLTNLILPGTVLAADIDKVIDKNKGKGVLATVGGGTLTATKEGGKTVLTDSAGHKATITTADPSAKISSGGGAASAWAREHGIVTRQLT